MKNVTGALLSALVTCAAPSALAGLIYDNTTTTTSNAFGTINPNIFTFGDYVTFGSGPTTISEVSFWMSANQDFGMPEGNFGLFVYDDNAGTVGSLLGSASLNAYSFPGNGNYFLTFSGLSIPVGTTAFVGLSIDNYNGDDTGEDFIGVEMYNPPTVGSSDEESMLVASGAGLASGSTPSQVLTGGGGASLGLNNMSMIIMDVPEPATATCLGGLGLLAFTIWRRRRAA